MQDTVKSDMALDNRRIWEAGAQAFVDRRVETILGLLPELGAGARLLDVGCLDGRYTRLFAEKVGTRAVFGIDVSLSEEARRNGVDFTEFDLNSKAPLPHPDASFDVVVCIETLEHVYPTDHLVRELRRVLRPGGVGIIDVPRLDSFLNVGLLLLGYQPPGVECSREARYGSINRDSVLTGHVAYFTQRALLELLSACGFRIVATHQVGQRSGWLMLQAAMGRRVGLPVRFLWWIYDALSLKKEYMVVKVER